MLADDFGVVLPCRLSRRGSGAGSSAEPIPSPSRPPARVTKQHEKERARAENISAGENGVLLSSPMF